jgi:hypothetical protein
MTTFTVYKGNKKIGIVRAENLEAANKIAAKKYPKFTEIYTGKKKEY